MKSENNTGDIVLFSGKGVTSNIIKKFTSSSIVPDKDLEKRKKLANTLKEIEIVDERTICVLTIKIYKGGIQTVNRNEELLIG